MMIITMYHLVILLCYLLLLAIAQPCHAQTLKSLISLSQDLENGSAKPTGNVNIIESSGNNNNGSSDVTTTLCYLPFLFAFSRRDDTTPHNSQGGYEGFAALSLAMEHLNTGNGEIVSELDGINERCPLKFYTNSFDTMIRQSTALNHIIDLTDRHDEKQQQQKRQRQQQELVPCAILGSGGSRLSISTSTISSSRDVPQISSLATSIALDDNNQYSLFGRTIPSDEGTAVSVVVKLKEWKVRYVAVLHINDAYGNAFADGIRYAANQLDHDDGHKLTVVNVNIDSGADDAAIKNAIQQLKATQYTYFFGVLTATIFQKVMFEAYQQKIAGTGLHTWLFSDSIGDSLTRFSFPRGTWWEKVLRGSGKLSATGGMLGMGDGTEDDRYDRLALAMRKLKEDERDLDFLEAHLPREDVEGKYVNHSQVIRGEGYLSMPGFVAPFLYDAAVGLGLAACQLASTSSSLDDATTSNYFTGEELYQAYVNTTFRGASGLVDLDRSTGTRKPQSAFFSLTNFVVDEDATDDATRKVGEQQQQLPQVRFKGVTTAVLHSGTWAVVEPYTFNDGTHTIPLDLPVVIEHARGLGTGIVVVGIILSCVVIGLAFIVGVWTYRHRDQRVVRASQPIFLYIIAAGTLLMGASIIPLSFPPGGASCMAFPWLLAIGFTLVFSALFTKTRRIKKIMKSAKKFKRIKLTPGDVMRPMIVLLFLNIVILSVWTAMDPLVSRTIVTERDSFDRVTESYDICHSNDYIIFISVLGVINLGSVLVAFIQAYQTRNISTELSESNYIFKVMYVILYGSSLGIPILVIAKEIIEAYYFVFVGLVFLICSSIFALIFYPKILATWKDEAAKMAEDMPTRWQMMGDNKTPDQNRPSLGEGIQIYSTAAKETLEEENEKLDEENQKLKQLCMTLSGNEGLDYESIMNKIGTTGLTSGVTNEEGMDQLLAFSKARN